VQSTSASIETVCRKTLQEVNRRFWGKTQAQKFL